MTNRIDAGSPRESPTACNAIPPTEARNHAREHPWRPCLAPRPRPGIADRRVGWPVAVSREQAIAAHRSSTASSIGRAAGETTRARDHGLEIGNTINYGSFGTTADIDCADGKSLNVGGSNNTLTVKGTCANVNIGGADNKVTLDKVDKELSVVGLNNTVTYKHGDPKVNDTGSGNTISKG